MAENTLEPYSPHGAGRHDGSTTIRAAGAVVWRDADADDGHAANADQDGQDGPVLVAVVHRPRHADWSLPKGTLREGEPALAGAVREVAEETGHAVTLGRRLGRTRHRDDTGRHGGAVTKVVDYWAARSVGGAFQPSGEVDQLRWVRPAEAMALLSYRTDRTVMAAFTALPARCETVLLVRHAEAGSRRAWPAADELRPLSRTGTRQAAALRAFLPLFGPRRVHAAPKVRCVDTVRELAADLSTELVPEPLLTEEHYRADPAAGITRLLDVAAGPPDTAVVCSQGGVIPDLVNRLAAAGAVTLPAGIRSRKASVWVLSLRDRRLLAGDYYPPPKQPTAGVHGFR